MPGNDATMTPTTAVDTQSEGAHVAGADEETHPLVSVVIPVRDGERYIGEALRAALDQTLRDLEVVVADNASTDRTLEVVAALGDDRVRVMPSAVDIGPGANWNRAVRAARGRFVKLLCADDVLEPSCVEQQVAAFATKEGDNIRLVCARRRIIDGGGHVLMERGFARRFSGTIQGPVAARLVIRSGGNLIGEPAAVMFRKDDALAVGLFDEGAQYVIDLDLWLRLLRSGSLYVINKPLASFRISAGSWSVSLAEKQAHQFRDLAQLHGRDPRLGVPHLDVVLGCLAARILVAARRLVYWRANGKGKSLGS